MTTSVIASDPSVPCAQPIRSPHPGAGGYLRATMTSKRKRDRDNETERQVKRQRRRKRSRSVPLMNDPDNAEKRQALKRLFGRICSVEMENDHGPADLFDNTSDADSHDDAYGDENDDPLLDSVPVDMDPEQLGFLVCAQETLRFLHGRGIPIEHPVFSRLRMRLLRGIGEMAMA